MNDCWGLSCNFPLINDFISFNIFSYLNNSVILFVLFLTQSLKESCRPGLQLIFGLPTSHVAKSSSPYAERWRWGARRVRHASPQEPKRFAWSDGNWIFKMIQNNVVMVKLTIWQFQCIYSNLRISNLQDFPREHVPGPSISLVSLEFA